MIRSMTGFGSSESVVAPFGKICVELRSSNHKFCDILFHLPNGFLSLEDKLKKEIEAEIKRGRTLCVVTFIGSRASGVLINKALLKKYIGALGEIIKQSGIKNGVSADTLINLPGVLVLEENKLPALSLWPRLKPLVKKALDDLVKMRQKEGAALTSHLKNMAEKLRIDLDTIRKRFKEAISERVKVMETNEERVAFLKSNDITEEVERLAFHLRNFKSKLSKNEPVGKELDFIAQEMQREANTMGAKSFDVIVSARVVQMKSCIEKIREQVQNIE